MSKCIVCQSCGGDIANQVDLVTIFSIKGILPYHLNCFAKTQMGWNPPGTPINGLATIWGSVFLLMLGVVVFLYTRAWIFWVIALILPALRLSSWLMYERHLQ